MNKLNNKKDLLIELYLNQRMHSKDIAKLLKVGKNTVIRALEKFNIQKANRFPNFFTSEQKSILYGSLLGDANLSIQKNGTNACLRMEHSMKQSEWLHYKFNYFKPWINSDKPSLYLGRITKGQETPSIKFTTVATPLFTEIYHKFY
jgi:LAGLIDADG DNA endonuclease family